MTTFKWNGLQISHSPVGTVRHGISSDGTVWSQYMPHGYGEILGTEGTDKKPVNVIIGSSLSSDKVFVASLSPLFSGEDKVLIGFTSKKEAKQGFLRCYNGDVNFLGSIQKISAKRLKRLLKVRRGVSLQASPIEYDLTQIQNVLQTVPTLQDKSTKVENPGDRKLSKEARKFNTELARRQGGYPSYAEVSQGADINISPMWIYSEKR